MKSKLTGILLLSCLLLAFGAYCWHQAEQITTDNAYIQGDIIPIAPKVAGYVVEVAVDDNQRVKAGELLFRIDDRDYLARLVQAQASVAAASAQLTSLEEELRLQKILIAQARAKAEAADAQKTLARQTHERHLRLLKSHSVSQSLVDESRAAITGSEASLVAAKAEISAQTQRLALLTAKQSSARAQLQQATASQELAQLDLDNTRVLAPCDGVVGNRQLRVGRYLQPGASMLDLVGVDRLWLVANFKETEIAKLQPKQRVHIAVDGFPELKLQGSIDSLAPGSGASFSLLPPDNATGNFVRVVQRVPVKIRFDAMPENQALLPGLSARVTLITGSTQ